MSKMAETPFFILAVAVLLLALPCWWLVRLLRKRQARQKEQKLRFEKRQLQPDYAAFTAHYNCEPAPSLRQLYDDRERVLDTNFEVRLAGFDVPWSVAWFEPMESGNWAEIEGFYAFANDGYGNLYIIAVHADDPEVFFLDHETGEREALGVTLSEFLGAERIR